MLPLEGYSIGFNCSFDIDEINELSLNNKVYVLMNKFLHLKIDSFREIYDKFNKNIMFIVEDIGLSDVIDKNRIILYENHILSNYKAINFLNSLGFNNLVINNDLTISEIEEIIDMSKCNLYYFYTSKNMLMYSRRNLVDNYNKHFKLNNKVEKYDLVEKVSKNILEITDYEDGSVVRNHKIFCASKYRERLSMNLIFDFSDIDEVSEKIILENLDNDKLCDLISDSILDAYLKQDEDSRVAVETFASKDLIIIAGQVTSKGSVEIEKLVRNVIKEVGYDNSDLDMDYRTCEIKINITKQSPDIALGVDIGGAGDQGIMFGYACDETDNYMPYAIDMAHKLSKRLADVRKNKEIEGLRPDGKVQVTVEYENDEVKRIDTILISTQHKENVDIEKLKQEIIAKIIDKIVPNNMIDEKTKIYLDAGRYTENWNVHFGGKPSLTYLLTIM